MLQTPDLITPYGHLIPKRSSHLASRAYIQPIFADYIRGSCISVWELGR